MAQFLADEIRVRRIRILSHAVGQGINRLNLAERVANHLGEAIVSGRYSVGETLPNEAMLSDTFSVSRSVIREALKMLMVKGFLAARPKRGTWIQPQAVWNVFDADVFSWLCKSRSTREVLAQSFDLRLTIEPAAAASVAQGAGDRERKDIQALLCAIDGASATPPAVIVAFHKRIVQASGNLFLTQLANFIELVIAAAARSYRWSPHEQRGRYVEIGRAFEDRKATEAEMGMRLLLQEQKESLCGEGSALQASGLVYPNAPPVLRAFL